MRISSAQPLLLTLFPPINILICCIWWCKETRKWKGSLKSFGWPRWVKQGMVTVLEADWPWWLRHIGWDRKINGFNRHSSGSGKMPRPIGDLPPHQRSGPASTAPWGHHGPMDLTTAQALSLSACANSVPEKTQLTKQLKLNHVLQEHYIYTKTFHLSLKKKIKEFDPPAV